MNALIRRDRFDDLVPEFFRRFYSPLALSESAPADIRIRTRRSTDLSTGCRPRVECCQVVSPYRRSRVLAKTQ